MKEGIKSIWKDTITIPCFPRLEGDIHTDVLIIGGGMAGILCAYYLKQAGVDYALVEANHIGQGISQNTTAKITSQHGILYHQLIQDVGKEKARMYLEANEQAVAEYRKLCSSIQCDFEEKSAYTYTTSDVRRIEQEVDAVQALGLEVIYRDKTELPFEIKGAIEFKNQGQFHPLKFIAEVVKGLHIYEQTFVNKIVDHTAITQAGNITAKKIIVATHFPFINRHGSYFMKLYQQRSYVIALKNAAQVNGMYIDEAQNGLSFRNYQDLLLIGGGGHRTGKKGENWEKLRTFAQTYYPDSQEVYAWATQDCMSLDHIPYIGRYSATTPDLYVATGFNKWGMTTSMVAARILSDMVTEKEQFNAAVFSPQRSMFKSQLWVNGIESMTNLLSFKTKRCTHLGCALTWNKAEHTWDCACHGSRFGEDGHLIDNPAMKSLKKDL